MKEFYSLLDNETDTFKGFNMEGREAGHDLFERDRFELLESMLIFMRGRFDYLLSHEVFRWMRDSFEHRRWPSCQDEAALAAWGTAALAQFAYHFSGLTLMADFNLDEAQHEYMLLKKELRNEPCFLLPSRPLPNPRSPPRGGVKFPSPALPRTLEGNRVCLPPPSPIPRGEPRPSSPTNPLGNVGQGHLGIFLGISLFTWLVWSHKHCSLG